jgi:hypothetical protein
LHREGNDKGAVTVSQMTRSKILKGGMKMSKWLKITFFTILHIGVGYFFGRICNEIDVAYELILLPSSELLTLLLKFLLALGALLVSAGLVAALLRPVGIATVAFILSGLALLVGWRISILTGAFALIYVLAGVFYTMGVDREMKERIRFSVRSISAGQAILSMALILVACGSLYLGYKEHIDREGFSLPDTYMDLILDQMETQIKLPGTEEEGDQVATELREEIKQNMEKLFYEKLTPYEAFIPLGLSVGIFMSLITITGVLLWIPMLFLRIIFSLLNALGVTTVVSEMQEVQRVVID